MAEHIRSHLAAQGVETEELRHDPAHSAMGEAARLGVPPAQVVKTIVLDTRDGHALAVIPASERLDMALVHRATGDTHAQLASEEELQRDYPEYELGTFPPLGTLLHAPVYVDPQVLRHEHVVFAAGRADTSLRARTDDLFRGQEFRGQEFRGQEFRGGEPVVVPLVREEDEKERELHEDPRTR